MRTLFALTIYEPSDPEYDRITHPDPEAPDLTSAVETDFEGFTQQEAAKMLLGAIYAWAECSGLPREHFIDLMFLAHLAGETEISHVTDVLKTSN